MKKHLPDLFVIVFFFFFSVSQAQMDVSHEVGLFFGTASLQTDFGERYDFPSENQATMSFGITHYLKFFGSQYNWRSGTSYFSEHFKLKTQFNYLSNSKIEHEGVYVEQDNQVGNKLKRMTGSVKVYNIGTNLEYYFFELEDYTSYYRSSGKLNPFIHVGIHYAFFQPDIQVDGVSLKGQEEPYLDLINKWQVGAIHLEDDSAFAGSAGLGVRYGLDRLDLVLDTRYQFFFTDRLEGLDAPNDPGNRDNDTMILVNLGIVYVFGKN